MSILIKGMKMPEKGLLEVIIAPDGIAYELERPLIDTEYAKVTKYFNAVSVPDHGDLIERDAAYDSIAEQEGGNYIDMDAVYAGLQDAPTVIPADGGKT